MIKQKTTTPKYVTKEILKKELSALEERFGKRINQVDSKIDGVEKRLDAKIDSKVDASTQSMKDYIDSRISPLNKEIQNVEQTLQQQGGKIGEMSAKMDRYFNGIVKMIEGLTGRIAGEEEHLKDHEQRVGEIITIHSRVDEHEKRIGVLEEKAG